MQDERLGRERKIRGQIRRGRKAGRPGEEDERVGWERKMSG
jgi:hypothetical protein